MSIVGPSGGGGQMNGHLLPPRLSAKSVGGGLEDLKRFVRGTSRGLTVDFTFKEPEDFRPSSVEPGPRISDGPAIGQNQRIG